MVDRNLARGILLAVVALAFGIGASRYPIGTLTRAGPGFFPFVLSVLLFVLALITIVQSRVRDAVPLQFDPRNVALIVLALAGFVVLSKWVSMIAGIAALVFVSSLAASTYSWKRAALVTAALVAIAFAFQKFLGLNLRLV